MASDFGVALSAMVGFMFVGLGIFFIWESLRLIVLNNPDGEPMLKDMILGFFKPKNPRHSPSPPPSEKDKTGAPPDSAAINVPSSVV